MSHFEDDVHRRITIKLREIIPDFVESDYPKFVAFLEAYYEFLEQYDSLPIASTFSLGNGVISVQSGNSTVIGSNTVFNSLSVSQKFKVGNDVFRVRSITNNTSLVINDIPTRSYFANTYYPETNKTVRQAKGALRQLLTFHDIDSTIDDFIPYFRDTYLRDIPQGLTEASVLTKRIIDFYQSRGSEQAYRFLFRALYGKEIDITYPREQVFTTSDNTYEVPNIIKVNLNTVQGDINSLVNRQIVGLTSNAQAYVLQITPGYEGTIPVAALSVEDVVVTSVFSNILLDSDDPAVDGQRLAATTYGIPPEGLSSEIYSFSLATEDATRGVFQAGEKISTLPINDPVAITGNIVGTVIGFTVSDTGVNYTIGDRIKVPSGFSGGYGAVGEVTQLISTDILSVNVISGGDGYYPNLGIFVDNSGTRGSGLSGYVSKVNPGHILAESGETILFSDYNDAAIYTQYKASRERINYYERGISISDVLVGNLLLNSDDPDVDGDYLLFENGDATYYARRNDQEVLLNAADWSGGNVSSALYGANLYSVINTITGQVNYLPLYVNGIQTDIGQIYEITLTSYGKNYIIKAPTVAVIQPAPPTIDVAGLIPITAPYYTFAQANLVPVIATGQIGKVQVIASGAGYAPTSNTFMLNSTTVITSTGVGGELGIVIGGITQGIGRFRNTKSIASGDMYMQSVDRYQPFSYVLAIDEDLLRYKDMLKKLLHPAGGLLLAQRTVLNELNVPVGSLGSDIELN